MIIALKTSWTCDPNLERYLVDDDVEMLAHPDWDCPMFVRADEVTLLIPEDSDMPQIREAYPWLEPHWRPDALAQCSDAYRFLTLCRKQSS